MKRCNSIIEILFSMIILCLPMARAQDGLLGALSCPRVGSRVLLGFEKQLVAADFDRDNKPDAAILLADGLSNGQTSFRVELHLTAGSNHAITFVSAENGLTISAVDLNRDGAPDIVIEREFTHERLQVFLNDGHGHFHKVGSQRYSLPNPSALLCRPWFAQCMPLSYLPPARGLELPGLRRVATMGPARSRLLNRCEDVPRAQMNFRPPSTTRAPPFSAML